MPLIGCLHSFPYLIIQLLPHLYLQNTTVYHKLLYFVDQQHTNIYVKWSLAPAAVKHIVYFFPSLSFLKAYQEMRN